MFAQNVLPGLVKHAEDKSAKLSPDSEFSQELRRLSRPMPK